MGKAPGLTGTPRDMRDEEWVIDPDTGEIRPDRWEPKVEPKREEVRPRPAPVVQAAYQTYD